MEQMIEGKVLIDGGEVSFSEAYNPEKTNGEYIQEFQQRAMNENKTTSVHCEHLRITQHYENGELIILDNGDPDWNVIHFHPRGVSPT